MRGVDRLCLAHFWVAFAAFLAASLLGTWQMWVRSPWGAHIGTPGQYFASGDGAPLRPVARDFDIAVAIDGEGIGAVVAAQSAAIGALASEISQALSY